MSYQNLHTGIWYLLYYFISVNNSLGNKVHIQIKMLTQRTVIYIDNTDFIVNWLLLVIVVRFLSCKSTAICKEIIPFGRGKSSWSITIPFGFRYSISVFIVPLTVLVVTYGAICRVIWQSAGGELGLRSPRLAPDSPPRCARSRRAPLISRAKINTVKQTVAVIAMYIACSTPFICAQLWATWDPAANESSFFDGELPSTQYSKN